MGQKADIKPKVNLNDVAKLKRMNPAQIYAWLANFYRVAYEDGLRDGEKEFDDAIILTEDEVRERVGDEVFISLAGDTDE